MVPTWFLSLWMSNSATTLLMVTITETLLENIDEVSNNFEKSKALKDSKCNGECEDKVPEKKSSRCSKWQKFGIGLSLGVCYSASTGGMGTLTGTPTNLVVYNLLTDVYGGDTGLNFGSWMAYALPISIIILFCIWLVICLIYLGPKELFRCRRPKRRPSLSSYETAFSNEENEKECEKAKDTEDISLSDIVNTIITEEKKVIGKMTYVGDTQPIVLVAFLAMVLPYNNPFKLTTRPGETRKEALARLNRPLLPWSVAESKCAWGVMILIGGGFALSRIVTSSGLSTIISESLVGVGTLPKFATVYLLTMMCSFLTEMVSNTATVSILTPIMFELASKVAIHPFCLTLPLVLATSLAFILPAATPPNAIIYAKGRVGLFDMMKTGLVLNLLAQLVVSVCTMTYGVPLFGLNAVPVWALNITS
ncbi:hypothetical protein Aperf_G00000082310 [Anoplocephala perfoliata]